MHYTGTIWRPPYEASSLLLEVTAGCTHHQCKFCTLYDDLPFKFRMTPMEDIEADLKEAKGQFRIWIGHKISRTFLTGANPFVLKASRLIEISDLIRRYFPTNQSIGCFSRITDITLKTDEELLQLKNAGNAVNSAKVFSKVNPRFISVDSLTLFPDTELYRMAQERKFIPAGEKERLEELQTFIKHLQIRTHLFANSVSNFYPTTAFLPKERDRIVSELQYIIDTVSEEEMQEYRRNLHTLG